MSTREGCGRVFLGVLLVVVACLVFAALAAAMVRTGEIPLYAPEITGFQPDPNDAYLPTTPVTFTFNQPMDTASVEAAFMPRPPVPGTFEWNEDRTQVTFVPGGEGYELGRTHTIRLMAGAKAGTLPRLTDHSVEWSFTLPPLVEAITPPPGEKDMGAWPSLQATFNYVLDCEATRATFSVTPAAAGEVACGDQTLTFSPTLPLVPDTDYVAQVDQVFLANEEWPRPGVSWEFQTAAPLTIVEVTPADGESLADLWTPVRIAFSRPVVSDSALQRFSMISEDGSPLPGEVTWQENGAHLIFQPENPLAPDASYQFTLEAGVHDELGFTLADAVERSFKTEPMLAGVTPGDGAKGVQMDEVIRVAFTRAMDPSSAEAGLTFEPPLVGETTWEKNTLIFAPEGGLAGKTLYEATLSADVRDASGAPLGQSHQWSFTTEPFLLRVEPKEGVTMMTLQEPVEYRFALPMDRDSVRTALSISPPTPGDLVWSDEGRTVTFQPDPAWVSGVDYEVTLAGSARSADGYQTLGEDHVLTFSTAASEVQFGEGPNVQVMDSEGDRAFQVIFRGADVADFGLYPITPTQFLDLYSSGFRGIGPQEPQIVETPDLTPTVEWREILAPLGEPHYGDWQPAQAHIPADAPPGIYVLAPLSQPEPDPAEARFETQKGLLVVLTDHALVLKRALAGSGSLSQAQVVAWDTEISGGTPVVSATVRLYDRDGTFLAEGLTGDDGLLNLDVPGDPGPLLALSDREGDVTVCGLSNEWSEAGWWWWWAQPPSRPLHTLYSYTDRPIYRPSQTVYFKDWIRADDDVSYTVPGPDLPVTVRLRDARDNVAATQVLTPTQFGTVHGEFPLADEPMLGTWNLETEVEGTTTRQPLMVEEYRKPEYEVLVHIPQKIYAHGEIISVTVDAAYYFGQPVAGAEVALLVYPTYSDYYYDEQEPQFGYPLLSKQGWTDAQGRWSAVVPTEEVFYPGNNTQPTALALEATVVDDSGQSVSSYQMVVVRRNSQGITLFLEKHGYEPGEAISFSAQVRDRDGNPVSGVDLTTQILGWDGQEVASSAATTGDTGEAFFSANLAEQGWYDVRVQGTDDGGREMRAVDYVWVYDPTGQAPWYGGRWGEKTALTVSTDREAYAIGDEAQVVVVAPTPGPALLTFERGATRHAEPVSLISGTNLITIPIRAEYAPNIHVTVNQFGPHEPDYRWGIQSIPEAQLHVASTQLLVPMSDRLLTVTLTADQETYAPGDEATFDIQLTDQEGQPVVGEVSLAVVDEAIYALAEDLSEDPFEVFYSPRPNLVRTFDSLHPSRWLFPEGPGLGGGNGEAGAPRRDFMDTAYWAPTVVTDENGQATVTFQLPDNLTEWRALARAVTTDTLVGQATTQIVVSQDLIVRPTLPRFVIQGDTITLTAVVHNFAERAVSATVELDVEGLILVEGSAEGAANKQVVGVPAGGSAMVGWPVRAEEPLGYSQGQPGEARVTVRATASVGARLAGRDAVELPLPIYPLAVPEVNTFAGTLTPDQPTDTITITLPSDAIEGLSRMEINLAPSVAPGLLDGLQYLIDYPFG